MPEESIQDLERAYATTFISFEQDGKNIPFLVSAVREGVADPVDFVGRAVGATKDQRIPMSKLSLQHPDLGVFNVGKVALYFSRIPARQWRKGFLWENVEHNYVAHEASAIAQVQDPLLVNKDDVTNSIFNPSYPSVEEAIADVTEGRSVARAINSKFWIGVAPFNPRPVIGYKMWYVGVLNEQNKVVLNKNAKHIAEELAMYMEVKQ